MVNYYELLEISQDADKTTVEQAIRKTRRLWKQSSTFEKLPRLRKSCWMQISEKSIIANSHKVPRMMGEISGPALMLIGKKNSSKPIIVI